MKHLKQLSNNSPCVQLTNVTLAYKKWWTTHTLLENISLEIFPAQCIALMGANGAGKSTLLRIIAGFIKPTCGTVVRFSPAFGYLNESVHLPPSFTIRTYLELMKKFNTHLSITVDDALTAVHLSAAADKKLATLSKGMLQRCMIALLLLHNADLLLLDEPFSGLDRESFLVVKTIIHQWQEAGKTILYTTHEEPLEQTDSILRVNNGTITQHPEYTRGNASLLPVSLGKI